MRIVTGILGCEREGTTTTTTTTATTATTTHYYYYYYYYHGGGEGEFGVGVGVGVGVTLLASVFQTRKDGIVTSPPLPSSAMRGEFASHSVSGERQTPAREVFSRVRVYRVRIRV